MDLCDTWYIVDARCTQTVFQPKSVSQKHLTWGHICNLHMQTTHPHSSVQCLYTVFKDLAVIYIYEYINIYLFIYASNVP